MNIAFIIIAIGFFGLWIMFCIQSFKMHYYKQEAKNRLLEISGSAVKEYNLLSPKLFLNNFIVLDKRYYQENDLKLVIILYEIYKITLWGGYLWRYIFLMLVSIIFSVIFSLSSLVEYTVVIFCVLCFIVTLFDIQFIFFRNDLKFQDLKMDGLKCLIFPFFYGKYLFHYYEKTKGGYDLKNRIRKLKLKVG